MTKNFSFSHLQIPNQIDIITNGVSYNLFGINHKIPIIKMRKSDLYYAFICLNRIYFREKYLTSLLCSFIYNASFMGQTWRLDWSVFTGFRKWIW